MSYVYWRSIVKLGKWTLYRCSECQAIYLCNSRNNYRKRLRGKSCSRHAR